MTNPLHETLANARKALLAERNASGHWEGELSTSALSTATSIVALGSVDPATHRAAVARACGRRGGRGVRGARDRDGRGQGGRAAQGGVRPARWLGGADHDSPGWRHISARGAGGAQSVFGTSAGTAPVWLPSLS